MALATSTAACLGENSSCARASTTRIPRTVSATKRALRGALRMNLARAITSITGLPTAAPLGLTTCMAAEVASWGELAEPVPNHVLADEHRHVLAPIVDRHGVPDHLRINGRGPSPRANHPLFSGGVQPGDFLRQVLVDEGALLERTTHLPLLLIDGIPTAGCRGDPEGCYPDG